MRVWYGYSKLTKKIMRKHELAIFFENCIDGSPVDKDDWVRKRMHVVHVRQQTKYEAADGEFSNRLFTKYRYFIDEKPFFGDIDKVLLRNSLVDKNHVKAKEREEMEIKLRKAYFEIYNIKEKPKGQLTLNLN